MSINKVMKNSGILKDKKVLIVGVGGTGCNVANLLARMNVKLTIIDNDIVDDTNLERQLMFDKNDLLKYKVDVVKEKLLQFTSIDAVNDELNEKNIEILKGHDLIIDCTDNIKTRLLINDFCKENDLKWIYTGAVSNIGTIYFIDGSPCYKCINQEKDGETSCEIGVLNSAVSIIAAIAVNIAVNYLVNGEVERDLIRINLKDNSFMKIKVKSNCERCKNI